MALRDIVTLQDDTPVLRQIARPVTVFDKRLADLLDDMAETMYAAGGVGLAAPQIGIRRRIVVIDISEDKDSVLELVNPVMMATDGEQVCYEGCLSIPGKRGKTHRPNRVIVQAMDRHGDMFETTAEGFLALALCHDRDHLDGKLYIGIMECELMDDPSEDDDDPGDEEA